MPTKNMALGENSTLARSVSTAAVVVPGPVMPTATWWFGWPTSVPTSKTVPSECLCTSMASRCSSTASCSTLSAVNMTIIVRSNKIRSRNEGEQRRHDGR